MENGQPEQQEKPGSRARVLIILGWLLKLAGILILVAGFWAGIALIVASIVLDFAVPRPRPKHDDRIVLVALGVFGVLFLVGFFGVWMAEEHPWFSGAHAVGLVGLVVCELFHYARADVTFLAGKRDEELPPENHDGNEPPQDEQPFRLKNDDH